MSTYEENNFNKQLEGLVVLKGMKLKLKQDESLYEYFSVIYGDDTPDYEKSLMKREFIVDDNSEGLCFEAGEVVSCSSDDKPYKWGGKPTYDVNMCYISDVVNLRDIHIDRCYDLIFKRGYVTNYASNSDYGSVYAFGHNILSGECKIDIDKSNIESNSMYYFLQYDDGSFKDFQKVSKKDFEEHVVTYALESSGLMFE